MARFILISGNNGSGKSLFAEQLVAKTQGKRYYIATMHPFTEDNDRRIEKHRQQRAGLEFETIETCYEVGNAELAPQSVVLLEDVSNLLSNAMFENRGTMDTVLQDILRLASRCKLLVAVTISGLSEDDYTGETTDYIRALNTLNDKLLEQAHVAVTMQDHVPIYQKGNYHDCI